MKQAWNIASAIALPVLLSGCADETVPVDTAYCKYDETVSRYEVVKTEQQRPSGAAQPVEKLLYYAYAKNLTLSEDGNSAYGPAYLAQDGNNPYAPKVQGEALTVQFSDESCVYGNGSGALQTFRFLRNGPVL